MKIERNIGRDYVIHYEDFQSLADDRPKTAANRRLQNVLETTKTNDWYGSGCHTRATFRKHAAEGWPELTKVVEQLSEQLKLNPDTLPVVLTQATRRRRVRTDSGSDLDIHAVYQGQLDRAWSNTRHEMTNVRRKAAHLYIHTGGSGGDSAEASAWRAAAAHRICEMFQRCGFAVEITVGSTADGVFADSPARLHTSFTAKRSDMPMDLNRVAVQSGLGWHRTYSFSSRINNDSGLRVKDHLGYTDYNAVTPYVLEREAAGELLIVVPAGVCSRSSAQRIVQEAQAKLEARAVAA